MTHSQAGNLDRTLDRLTEGKGSSRSINAGLGGFGSGVGLIAMAQHFGLHTIHGTLLLYASPAASVLAGAFLYWLKLQVGTYLEEIAVRKSRKTLERQAQNPHASAEYRAKIQLMLEDLDHTVAKAELARVKSIKRKSQ